MDEKQVEAAARAMLEPGRLAQKEHHRRQAIAAHARREQRLMGGFGMLGLVVAVVTAYFMHKNLLAFVGIGAPVGIIAGWLIVSWHRAVSRPQASSK